MCRESIRATLDEVAEAQAAAYAPNHAYPELADIAFDHDAYILQSNSQSYCAYGLDGCLLEGRWIAVARHRASPHGKVCAVALNIEPAHVAGDACHLHASPAVILRRVRAARPSASQWTVASSIAATESMRIDVGSEPGRRSPLLTPAARPETAKGHQVEANDEPTRRASSTRRTAA